MVGVVSISHMLELKFHQHTSAFKYQCFVIVSTLADFDCVDSLSGHGQVVRFFVDMVYVLP